MTDEQLAAMEARAEKVATDKSDGWHGNILGREGATFRADGFYAHVIRHARLARSFVIAVYEDAPYRIEVRPMIELVAVAVPPDESRRQAQLLVEWAAAAAKGGE